MHSSASTLFLPILLMLTPLITAKPTPAQHPNNYLKTGYNGSHKWLSLCSFDTLTASNCLADSWNYYVSQMNGACTSTGKPISKRNTNKFVLKGVCCALYHNNGCHDKDKIMVIQDDTLHINQQKQGTRRFAAFKCAPECNPAWGTVQQW
ncbi:hypothetical protein FPQ18DRAFT_381404 [Pyronema domesticum]|uniref:Cyanovirin-N domain-containing protein n=1 Tax=Pyronema omphalodes (strain CBS 100304) TaxID=1076935 RepID=U4LN80_PYROM|nr:hypothetical protein FPQ18DRAFT_381404 [Pyronema domesticum]CCX33609.1 Protein of unknown function [Pyronema omphalodes CBS 100304]